MYQRSLALENFLGPKAFLENPAKTFAFKFHHVIQALLIESQHISWYMDDSDAQGYFGKKSSEQINYLVPKLKFNRLLSYGISIPQLWIQTEMRGFNFLLSVGISDQFNFQTYIQPYDLKGWIFITCGMLALALFLSFVRLNRLENGVISKVEILSIPCAHIARRKNPFIMRLKSYVKEVDESRSSKLHFPGLLRVKDFLNFSRISYILASSLFKQEMNLNQLCIKRWQWLCLLWITILIVLSNAYESVVIHV